MKQTVDSLKAKFESDDIPTGDDFANLLDSFVHKDDNAGGSVLSFSSRIQAEEGTDNSSVMTPLRVRQAILAQLRLALLPLLKTDIEVLYNILRVGFAITDVIIERFPTKLKATIVISKIANVALEYSKDNLTWQTLLIFDNLTATEKFYAREVATPTNRVEFTKQDSINVSTTNNNEIADIQITVPAMLNQVDLLFLGDFEIPNHPNPRFANQKILELMITGPFWKEQNTVGNIFKKGITSVDYRMLTGGTEYQEAPYSASFQSPIDIRNISFTDYAQNYFRLNLGTEDDADAFNSVDYTFYGDITNNLKFNVPQFFKGNPLPYFRGRIVMTDIENGSINLKESNRQDYVNRMVAITKAYLDGVGPDTLVSHMYQSLPKQDVGFGVTKAMYAQPADSSWTMTANTTAYNFPQYLVGKSLANIDDRFASCFEYYPPYETFLDEGVQLYNVNNEPLKDFGGNVRPPLSHFGTIDLNRASPSFKHSQVHWAAHCAAALGLNRRLLARERFLILQANNWNMLYYFNNYAGQPAHATIKQIGDGNERYPMPDYMVSGMVAIAFFSNAIYEHWDSPISIGMPTDRSQGEARPDYPAPARIDYRGVAAQQAMAKRISLGFATINGTTHTLAEMIDGTEIYLLETIKVNYLTVAGFDTPKAIYPTDWMEYQLSPVMGIVNVAKRLIAIWGCIAYSGSLEPTQVEVSYTDNGFNFRKRINLQAKKNSLFIFSLDDTSLT